MMKQKIYASFVDGFQTSPTEDIKSYQPSGAGGTHSPSETPHHLKNLKWPPGGPKMADGVLKGVQS